MFVLPMMAAVLITGSGPVVSPEFNINPPVPGLATDSQVEPAVAFDGTNHLVVWQDSRFPFGLRAARLPPSSEVLDPGGIVLPMGCSRPAVAYGAGRFMVACPGRAVRVSSDGVLEDATPISLGVLTGHDVDIAFNGESFLVVKTEGNRGVMSGVYSTRVSPDGTPSAQDTLVSASQYHCWESTVTAVGSSFLVGWSYTDGQIVGRWVSPTGAPDGNPFAMTNTGLSARYPALASDGSGYMLVYQRGLTGSTSSRGIHARYVDASGAAINYTLTTLADQEYPDVGWSTTDSVFQAVWVNNRVTPVSIDGATLATNPASVSTASSQGRNYSHQRDANPRIGSTGSLVVYNRRSYDMTPDVLASPFGRMTSIPIALGANAELLPAAAGGPNGYFLVWQDDRLGRYGMHDDLHEIYGTRISQAGEVLDPTGLRISQGETTEEKDPVVAWNGGGWLVAWKESASVNATGMTLRARRLSATGEWRDTTPLTFGQSSFSGEGLAAASNGSNTLVVWGGYSVPLGVVLVPSSGTHTVLATPTGAGTGILESSVAGTSSTYLVVWEKAGTIYGQRYSASGTALDTPMSLASGNHPVVATNGKDFLVAYTAGSGSSKAVWALGISSSSGQTLFASKQLGSSFTSYVSTKGVPTVAWDGYSYLVAWPDSTWVSVEWQPRYMGVRLAADGAFLDAAPFAVLPTRKHLQIPDYEELILAGSSDADLLAVTNQFDTTPTVGAHRLVGRRVHVDKPPRALPATLATLEDTPKTLTLTAADWTGQSVTYAISRAPSASTGTVQLSRDQVTFTPALNWSGTTWFQFTATNSVGPSLPATVNVTVAAVNDPPVFTMPTDKGMYEDAGSLSLYVTGIAPGPSNESSQTWTYFASTDKPFGVDVTTYYSGDNLVQLFVTPKPDWNGEALISFRVTDNGTPEASRTQTFKLTVHPVDDAAPATLRSVTPGGGR